MRTTAKFITAISIGLSMLIACDSIDVKTAEMKKEESVIRDSFDRVFTETLRDINSNLEVINEKEGVLMLGPGSPEEKNISEKEKVLRNIKLINSLIDDSREKMAVLDKQVKDYSNNAISSDKKIKDYKLKVEKLEKLMATTEERLKGYEEQLASLKIELTDKNFKLAELDEKLGADETKIQMLQEYSDRYEKIAYTAYYTCGDHKQLKEEGVVKKGLFTRFSGTDELADQMPVNSFTPIDRRVITSIPLNAKKVRVVSQHPSRSYTLVKEGNKVTSIEIMDPEEFWKTSKYLVIETH